MIKLLVLTLLFFASETNAQQVYNKLNVKELDVTSRVNVTSTTKSSKPCPAMTETQRNAIVTPLNGSCIYNTTTLKLNVYNGTVWKAAGGGVDNWLTATAYSVDDIVIESSKIYQCLIAHTSGTFATDLAASRWVEISATVAVNLTGPITSVGNATSIASQTGTGSTFVVQNTPTLTTPNIGAATGTSLTITDKLVGAYQTPNNLLNNGDVELTDITPITCTTGACTRTTTSGEFSQGTAALKVVPAANVLDASWIATTPLGIQKQGFARVIYKVPSTCSTTFVVRTMVDGATQTEVPTSKLIMDNTFRSIEVPLTFGSTSAGIKVYANGTCTGDTFFDGAILSQGLGLQNLQTDNVYTAQADIAGAVSRLNKAGWVSFTSITSTYNFALTGFTVAPNCWANSSTLGGGSVRILNVSSTSSALNIEVTGSSGITATTTISFGCQKSGNDYLSSSANVYSQASGNYPRRAYTPTFTGFGTVSNVTCLESREGEYNNIECNFTTGTATGVEARVSLPNGNVSSSLGPTLRTVGSEITNGNAATFFGIAPLIEPSVSYLTFGRQDSTGGALSKRLGNNVVADGSNISFTARVPISGWTNSSAIVGSFAELGIKLQTSTATTSGTSVDYTIPTGVKRVTLMLSGVSTNGSTNLLVQIGTSGGLQTTGYLGAIVYHGASNSVFGTNITTGCAVISDEAAEVTHGSLTMSLMDSSTGIWVGSSVVAHSNENYTGTSGCSKTLNGTIDRIRLTTVNGTDVFDAGSVNVSWEY